MREGSESESFLSNLVKNLRFIFLVFFSFKNGWNSSSSSFVSDDEVQVFIN